MGDAHFQTSSKPVSRPCPRGGGWEVGSLLPRSGTDDEIIRPALANNEVVSVKEYDALLSRIDKSKPVTVLLRRGEWAQYVLIRPSR